MNVGQLRAALAVLPDDMPVVQARDPEGNGYYPLGDVEVGKYSEGDGEMIHPDDVDEYFGVQNVLCLWPGY